MAIHNEKTRRVKAVRRRGRAERFDGFLSLRKVDVRGHGALQNEAGEVTRGWTFRQRREKDGIAWFAERQPVAQHGFDFDVMCAGECVAIFHVEPSSTDHPDLAQLRALDGSLLASINRALCRDAVGNELVRWSAEDKHFESKCHADRRLIGTVQRTKQLGAILTTYDSEVTFEADSTGFERLLFSSMIVLYHVVQLPEWQAD